MTSAHLASPFVAAGPVEAVVQRTEFSAPTTTIQYAVPITAAPTTSYFFGLFKRTTYPTAGEMSVQYNQYEKKYVMLYSIPASGSHTRTN